MLGLSFITFSVLELFSSHHSFKSHLCIQSTSWVHLLSPVSLVLPVAITQRADAPGLEPPGDAVEVEGVVTHAPGHWTLLLDSLLSLVGLTLDAPVHDVVPADGAVVHHDVPGPQRHSVKLFHLVPARADIPLCYLGLAGRPGDRRWKPFFGIWI